MAGCGRQGMIQRLPSLPWKIFTCVFSGQSWHRDRYLVGDGGQTFALLSRSNRQSIPGGVYPAGSRRSVSPSGPKQLAFSTGIPQPPARAGAERAAEGAAGCGCWPSDSARTACIPGIAGFSGFACPRPRRCWTCRCSVAALRIWSQRSIPTPPPGRPDSSPWAGRGALSSPSGRFPF